MEHNIYKVITKAGTGTGFRVRGFDGVLTNYHVVEGCREVALEDANRKRHLATVVMVNPDVDLAFLSSDLPEAEAPQIKLRKDIEPKGADKIFIHGYPFGLPYTVTEGIISSPRQMMGQRHFLQTDAAVNPGNSGGPMLDGDGTLLGITTSKFHGADNVGFGIRHSDVIEELLTTKIETKIFHLKCSSCNNLISEKVDFCPNCGNNVDQRVFEEFELSGFAKFVEEALEATGINPVLARAGNDNWEFYQGSALIRIFVFRGEYLFATSPLNKLPKTNLQPLLEHLVSDPVPNYQLGISDNHIYLSYRAHMADLWSAKANDIKQHLSNMALEADRLDDYFVQTYGCEMSEEGLGEAGNLVPEEPGLGKPTPDLPVQ